MAHGNTGVLRNSGIHLSQSTMKTIGIIILVIGLIGTIYTGFNFITKEKVVDIGKIEISADKKHGLRWSPILGIVFVAVGAGLYMVGSKKKLA